MKDEKELAEHNMLVDLGKLKMISEKSAKSARYRWRNT